MASKKYLSVSRSVACSLAALLVLTGAMFMVTTFQQDSEEWVLVEDEVIVFDGLACDAAHAVDESAECVFTFDEETSTYSLDISGGDKAASTSLIAPHFTVSDDFDYSKNYKFSFVSTNSYGNFVYWCSVTDYTAILSLRSVPVNDDGVYSADVVLLDQFIEDLKYKNAFIPVLQESSSSATYPEAFMSFQVYELQTDNTGSIAAGVTGLLMIVFGIFAMPSVNVLRRR